MEIMVKIWGPEISAYLNSGFSGKAMVSNQMAAKKVISARFSSCICSVSCRVLRPRHAKLRSGKMTPGCLLIWCEKHRFNIVSMVPYHVHCPPSPPALVASSSSKMSPQEGQHRSVFAAILRQSWTDQSGWLRLRQIPKSGGAGDTAQGK